MAISTIATSGIAPSAVNLTAQVTGVLPIANGGTGSSGGATPSGVIQMWPTASAPTGFLLCAGDAISRTTYAALFAVIGTTFGTGDGSTTFNLPDYRNRMAIGAGSTYSANSQGGSADAVVVSHTHTASVTDPGHTHTINIYRNNVGSSRANPYGAGTDLSQPSTNSSTTGISVSNSTTGVSGTNANLPPYIGIYFIIKT